MARISGLSDRFLSRLAPFRCFVPLALVTLLLWAPLGVHAQSILISSNSGSAIAQLYTNQSYSYNFGITTLGGNQSLLLTNIGIYMDRGNSTTQPFHVEIYGGLGGSGPLLTNFTVAATNVASSMSLFNLLFQGSLTLSNGNYSLTLSSSAASGGSTQYTLRQGTLSLIDSNNAPLPLTYWVQDNNASGTAGTNFQANFVLANYQITTNSINYGNYRLGTTLSTAVTLTNNAIYATNSTNGVVTERLTTATATTNVATISGLSTNLLSVNQTTNFTVGMSSANVGTNSGVVTLTYNSVSNGTASTRPASLGTNPVGIGSQQITVTGVGYRLADDAVSTTNVSLGRFHIGYTTNMGSLSAAVGITNTAANDGYSEGLAVANNGTSGGATASGIPGSLVSAGANTSINVGLGSVSAVGTNSGSVTLGFQSSGTGTSGFAATNIGTQVVNVSAQGYSGQAFWNTDAGGSWNNFDNWDVPGGTPGIDGVLLSTNDQATFGSAISTARTVNLNGQSPVLTLLSFSNASASYTVAPGSGGSITMGTESAGQTIISNAAGSHTVSAAISLARATQARVATNAVLTLSGGLNGTNNFSKSGTGKLVVDGTGDLSGSTSVNAGTMEVNGSIASSTLTVADSATLSGSGTVGETALAFGSTISPGNSPGTLTVAGDLTWGGGANYNWQIFDAATNNAPGTMWDLISATGQLDLGFLSDGNRFNINLWTLSGVSPDTNGLANNFINTQSYRWTIVTAAGGITGGFSTNKFNVNLAAINGTSGWANDLGGGSIYVDVQGNNLDLVFTPGGGPQPVPEPGTWAAALMMGAAGYVRWLRRSRQA